MLPPMSNKPDLKRTPGTALHRQIFLILKDSIAQGSYAPGTALPTEEALVQLFGASRATVRRALADLALEGLVQRRHGLGTFVREGPAPGPGMASLSFIDELRHMGQQTDVRVVTLESALPSPAVRAFLQLPAGQPAVRSVRVRMAGKVPLMITEAWVPPDLGRTITVAALKRSPMYELLNRLGIKLGRVLQEISAESADPHRAELLKCELGTALIRMSRLMHDDAGRPVMYVTAYLTPQHSRILMEIQGDAIGTMSAGHVTHDPALLGQAGAGKKRTRT